MNPRLTSPSVCVIDDEEEDYRPILDALIQLGIGCVHVKGDSMDTLPPEPFNGLRLIFTDLHLNASTGKSSASHAANVFTKVVSPDSASAIVVIWSKYAQDVTRSDIPADDQTTEADLFQREVLAADVRYKSRLIFADIPKPKLGDRPTAWTDQLKGLIEAKLREYDAIGALWTWESLIVDAGRNVSTNLIQIASSLLPSEAPAGDVKQQNDQLRRLLGLLAQQQGGPDCTEETAARHLLTVLAQLGQDEIDFAAGTSELSAHGGWLALKIDPDIRKKCRAPRVNAILLTATVGTAAAPFAPGTVFLVEDPKAFEEASGLSIGRLVEDCSEKMPTQEFQQAVKPILIEITPSCDFHQGHRRSAMLVGGLMCPASLARKAKSKDACKTTPIFEDRFSDPASDCLLVFCSRYRFTVKDSSQPTWLRPWLRLREILVADIRNWYASQSSRVGLLSF